jgi:EAL and modified HD-GYP domain-containing signal transduction protein
MMMENLYLARHPVYDRHQAVMGYELLYRGDSDNAARVTDDNQATLDTLLNSFMHIGLENIVGSSLAFLNLPSDFITSQTMIPMHKGQCVLEIMESVVPSTQVISGLKFLKQQGYRIALHDFDFMSRHRAFLELADYVKLSVNNRNEHEIRTFIGQLTKHKVKTIAEKIETPEMHALCMSMNFDYFQGYFYCRPHMISGKNIPANKLVVMNLLAKLQNPDTDLADIETILSQDVGLSYKLLRYINSATFSRRKEINSIKDAVMLLGLSNVRNWLSLILMSSVASNKPAELIVTAMVRGKMCELLASRDNPGIAPQMFITGLFSVLDALMDTPMADLLDTIVLGTPIRLALIDRSGAHGEALDQVMLYESGNWDVLSKYGARPELLRPLYLDAIHWADQTTSALR